MKKVVASLLMCALLTTLCAQTNNLAKSKKINKMNNKQIVKTALKELFDQKDVTLLKPNTSNVLH